MSGSAQSGEPHPMARAVLRGPHEGAIPPLEAAPGWRVLMKATAAETGGAYLLRELRVPAQTVWAQPHRHPEMEEALYAVSGRLTARCNGDDIDLAAGGFLLIPRGVTHSFANRAAEPATVLNWFTPPPRLRERSDPAVASALTRPATSPPRIVETGIKAIDLLCPLLAGGVATLAGLVGTGLVVLVEELALRLAGAPAPPALVVSLQPEHLPAWHEAFLKVPWYTGGTAGALETSYITEADEAPAGQAHIQLSPALGGARHYPAVDEQRSWSHALDPAVVGAEHAGVAGEVRALLRGHPPGAEGGDAGATPRARAARLRAFLTQPFVVAEPFTGMPGVRTPRLETVAGCRAILSGVYDALPAAAFLMAATAEEAAARWAAHR